jgi:hypothetical protein
MTFERFHNALRILRSIDRWELREAGIEMTDERWGEFCDEPFFWFISAPDADARKVWAIMEARQR